MGLCYFGVCALLTFGPLWATLKTSRLARSRPGELVGSVLLIYGAVQLVRIFCTATLAVNGPEDVTQGRSLSQQVLASAMALVDGAGIAWALKRSTYDYEQRVQSVAWGWATAQAVTSRLAPLYWGALGTEFSWEHYQSGVEANIEMFGIFCMALLAAMFNRRRRGGVQNGLIALMAFYAAIPTLAGLCCMILPNYRWLSMAIEAGLTGVVTASAWMRYSNEERRK